MTESTATLAERIGDRMARSDLSWKVHRFFYRLSGGRMGGAVRGIPVLLLTTKGRRTQQLHTVPLMYLREGGRILVVASNAANPDRPPGWWFNLQAHPEAEVQVMGERRKVRACDLDPDERDALWPRLVAHNPNWGKYQRETERRIGVVALQLDPNKGSA